MDSAKDHQFSVKGCYDALQEDLMQYIDKSKREVFIIMHIETGYQEYLFTMNKIDVKLELYLIVDHETKHQHEAKIEMSILIIAIAAFVERFKKFGFNISIRIMNDDVDRSLRITKKDQEEQKNQDNKLFRLFPIYSNLFDSAIQFSTSPVLRRVIFINSDIALDFIRKNRDIKQYLLLKIRYSTTEDMQELSIDYCHRRDCHLIEYLCDQEIANDIFIEDNSSLCYLAKLFKLVVQLESSSVWGRFLLRHKLYDPRLLLWIELFARPIYTSLKIPRIESE